MYRVDDDAVLNPETTGTARVITGDGIDALPHQFGHDKACAHLLNEIRITYTRIADDKVMHATRVAGSFQTQFARIVTGQHIALEHTLFHQVTRPGCHTLTIK